MLGLLLAEPVVYVCGGDSTYIRNVCQFFNGCSHQGIQAAKGGCQNLAGLCTYLADTQGINQPADILLLAGFNGCQQLLCCGRTGFPQALDVVQAEVIDIRRRLDQTLFNQAFYNSGTQALDIHGVPADKMGNMTAQLGRTFCTCAAQERSIFILFYLCIADGALFGQMVRDASFRTFCKIHFQNFRNDFAGLADHNGITDTNITLRNEVLIMECGIRDRGTRQANSTNNRFGRQNTGSANLNDNVLNDGGLDFRRIFVGRCPLGKLCCSAKPFPLRKIIHLDDGTIDITG